MKYVCFKDETGGESVFVFPRWVMHRDFAGSIRRVDRDYWLTPISAGFVSMDGGKLRCHGKSESLNLGSRSEDTRLLNEQITPLQY